MKIVSPKSPKSASTMDCQRALDPAFRFIVMEAENAGWSKAEIAVALRELAEAHVMDLATQGADMESQIVAALRR